MCVNQHKHLPEIKVISGLDFEPIFNPYICDYIQGMSVSVGLHTRLLGKKVTAKDVWELYAEHYKNCNFVKVCGFMGEGTLPEPFIPANIVSTGACGSEFILFLLFYAFH